MRQTLPDDFWGLHKNMNCKFPLKITFIIRYIPDKYKTKKCVIKLF